MLDCLIIGGGVIGLSLAYELACRGRSVRVIDRGQPGQEASWAGAGILPPGVVREQDSPYEQLAGLSHQLHPQWAERLRSETGIDTGFRRCGGIYMARSPAATQSLRQTAELWRSQGLSVDELSPAQLAELEPSLRQQSDGDAAWLLPEESQLRNPRHVKALIAACLGRGVEIGAGVEAHDFEVSGERVLSVQTSTGQLRAQLVCIAGGAWSRSIARRLGVEAAIRPVRGQMVLLRTQRSVISRVINDGPRYLVPRVDGRLLVGSTEEDAGFDRSTTADGVAGLLSLATTLVPDLASAQLERCWAGLRPGPVDGLPYLGRLPQYTNAFIASGHFRSGLQLSTATAVVMADLMCGRTPAVDLTPFPVGRI